MNETEQRIAIAEACGKHVVDVPFTPCLIDVTRSYLTDTAYKEYRKVYPSGSIPMRVPDYLHDLNAMHEAENAVIFKEEHGEGLKYSQALRRITEDDKSTDRWQWNATASQRAEAFLRTIGKWKD